jgi:hypothetical protein
MSNIVNSFNWQLKKVNMGISYKIMLQHFADNSMDTIHKVFGVKITNKGCGFLDPMILVTVMFIREASVGKVCKTNLCTTEALHRK